MRARLRPAATGIVMTLITLMQARCGGNVGYGGLDPRQQFLIFFVLSWVCGAGRQLIILIQRRIGVTVYVWLGRFCSAWQICGILEPKFISGGIIVTRREKNVADVFQPY